MQNTENQYERKALYNPDRQTFVDADGNYVYLVWDEENRCYRHEVCVVGEDISPEIRSLLDEMDAEEERRLYADNHHLDKVFDGKKQAHSADKTGRTPNPMNYLPQCRQRTLQDALRENPRIGKLLLAMEKLNPEQVNLLYAIYGEMQFSADVAREQGVSLQTINKRLKKIHNHLVKLMAEMDEA